MLEVYQPPHGVNRLLELAPQVALLVIVPSIWKPDTPVAEIEELNIATRSFTLGSERELQSKLEETGIWHKVLKESWLRDPPPADELLFTPYCSPLPEELLFGLATDAKGGYRVLPARGLR